MSVNSQFTETSLKKMVTCARSNFKEKLREDTTHAERVSEFIVDKMMDDLLVEVISDAYRSFKMGYNDHISLVSNVDEIESNDVFYPETVVQKTKQINCPRCNRQIHASRFAPHLQKCMETGRTSSIIASKRIANNSKECSFLNGGSDEEEELKATPDKGKNIKKFDGKRKKDPVRKTKPYKTDSPKSTKEASGSLVQKDASPSNKVSKDNFNNTKNIKDTLDTNEGWSTVKVTPLLSEDNVIVLSSMCCAKSDGKFCGRSSKCNRHTDAERAEGRKLLASEGIIVTEDADNSKTVLGNFSNLNIASKKKGRQKPVVQRSDV